MEEDRWVILILRKTPYEQDKIPKAVDCKQE